MVTTRRRAESVSSATSESSSALRGRSPTRMAAAPAVDDDDEISIIGIEVGVAPSTRSSRRARSPTARAKSPPLRTRSPTRASVAAAAAAAKAAEEQAKKEAAEEEAAAATNEEEKARQQDVEEIEQPEVFEISEADSNQNVQAEAQEEERPAAHHQEKEKESSSSKSRIPSVAPIIAKKSKKSKKSKNAKSVEKKIASKKAPIAVVPSAAHVEELIPASKQISFGTSAIIVSEETLPRATAAHVQRPATQGKPISHKVWQPLKDRFSTSMSIVKSKSWKTKEAERAHFKSIKEREKDILEQRKIRLREKRDFTLKKQKRRADNELKSIKVQTITNTAKIKKMSKKQLRMIKRM